MCCIFGRYGCEYESWTDLLGVCCLVDFGMNGVEYSGSTIRDTCICGSYLMRIWIYVLRVVRTADEIIYSYETNEYGYCS